MDREQAIRELKEAQGDTELKHLQADDILCRLLVTLGYQDVVNEWERVPKWYS